MAKKVLCPTCQKEVEWVPASKWRPFCSERCQMVDLGDWFTEKHVIADEEDGSVGLDSSSEDDLSIH